MARHKKETFAKLVEMCRARYPGRSEEDVREDALELARLQMQQGDDADGTYNAAFEYGAALGASGSSPARNYEQVLDARRAVTQMAATREDARERTVELKAAEWAANARAARNAKLAEMLSKRRAERVRLDAAKDTARQAASAALRQLREEGMQFAHVQDDFDSAEVGEEQRALVESFETAHQRWIATTPGRPSNTARRRLQLLGLRLDRVVRVRASAAPDY